MEEKILQYIWSYQLFAGSKLYTRNGEKISIIEKGILNKDAGPDFLDAQIQVGNKMVKGAVEIDFSGNYWHQHNHNKNKAYNQVILHVVWEDSRKNIVVREDGTPMPVLELKDYINPKLLGQYERILNSKSWIPCKEHLPRLGTEEWEKMIETSVMRRLERKRKVIYNLFKANDENTEATACQVLGSSLGCKMNSGMLCRLLQLIPDSVLVRGRKNIEDLEAILLGQAGLLELPALVDSKEKYEKEILIRYKHLFQRYGLTRLCLTSSWKFMRLRPANFPSIRIAQLCMFLYRYHSIFEVLLNQNIEHMYETLCVVQSSYWQNHYRFGQKSKRSIQGVGKSTAHGIMINSVVPLLAAYGGIRNDDFYMEKGLDILKKLPAEEHHITKKWRSLGMPITSAFASQGALELYTQFCKVQKCFSCRVGQAIFKR